MNFSHLIEPFTPEQFSAEYWEKKPLAIRRNSPGHYQNLMRKSDLENLIFNGRVKVPELNVFSKGRSISPERLQAAGWAGHGGSSASPDTGLLYSAYSQGFTIVARSERWPAIAKLCRDLEASFHHICAAELYATPRLSQGFDVHVDKGGVFVVQLEGMKHWQIYRPVREKVDELGDRIPYTAKELEAAAGPPFLEVTLEQGDLLYLPRGFPHRALTSDSPSFHLSVGLVPFDWNDLIRESLQAVAAGDPEFHRGLPLQFMHEPDLPELRRNLAKMIAKLQGKAESAIAVRRLARRFASGVQPSDEGHFDQIDRMRSISLSSSLQKRPGVFCAFFRNRGAAVLQIPGAQLKFPLEIAEAVKFIAQSDATFSLPDLPGDWARESRLLFARKLVTAGVLRTVSSDIGTAPGRESEDVEALLSSAGD